MSFPSDIQQFLSMYPRFRPNPNNSKNLEFYKGKGKALPGSLKIDELLDRLENDWNEVESNHGFIQWLFPIPEHGMNWQSQPLEPHEAEAMSADPIAMERLMRSYEMMLAFYGIRMIDRNIGLLGRADNWKSRFAHLLTHPHNLLRITRILKSLTILSPPPPSSSPPNSSSTHTMPSLLHHPPSLVLFLVAQHNEQHLNLLPGTTAGGSLERFWSGCLRGVEEREWVCDLIEARKMKVAGGGYAARTKWGEKEYEEWVRGRFGGGGEEEELEIVEEVLSEKEGELNEKEETTRAMEVVVVVEETKKQGEA